MSCLKCISKHIYENTNKILIVKQTFFFVIVLVHDCRKAKRFYVAWKRERDLALWPVSCISLTPCDNSSPPSVSTILTQFYTSKLMLRHLPMLVNIVEQNHKKFPNSIESRLY